MLCLEVKVFMIRCLLVCGGFVIFGIGWKLIVNVSLEIIEIKFCCYKVFKKYFYKID